MREFEFNLENNLFSLHRELLEKKYRPGPYKAFFVFDPKKRHIHKAEVIDRVVHQALFRILYPIFNQHFIFHSYSSRLNKGTHKGVKRLFFTLRKASQNWKRSIFVLKCDIRKFFDSIDHEILKNLLAKQITDKETLELLNRVIDSFSKNTYISHGVYVQKGIPLGNVTSQLFGNIYLNELDQFIKHKLKTKYYFRYADDFLVISEKRGILLQNVFEIQKFLKENLRLDLHPNKISIRKIKQGIDFVGYVVLQDVIVLRTSTKNRILRKIRNSKTDFNKGKITKEHFSQSLVSYLGVLKHCHGYKIKRIIKKPLITVQQIDYFAKKE